MSGSNVHERPVNAFTVDVEEWFCSHLLETRVPRTEWYTLTSRVERQTGWLLDLLARHSVRGTFFVLGWVAERHPRLVRLIADAGHEIASHGYNHRLLYRMEPDECRADIARAVSVTCGITGAPMYGYRAPAFSITRRNLWALDVLLDAGFRYDSSVFPIAGHPDYGMPGTSLDMYHHDNGLLEVPLSCAQVAGTRVPCAGGGYFRHLPYRLTRMLMERCHREGRQVIFYIHPWELDPELPVQRLPRLERFRLYHNLHSTRRKLEQLLRDFTFTSIDRLPQFAQQKERSTDAGLLSLRRPFLSPASAQPRPDATRS